MNIQKHEIKIVKSARYFSNTIDPVNVKSVWFVIHGYAQLAKEFIHDFNFLLNDSTLIIAPEGLSKFYSRNKIGASWMTKEDRLNEIKDYLNYLEKVIAEVKSNIDISASKKNLLGFSQGVHTAVRFFIHTGNHFDKLILCSSDFPNDADFNSLNSKLKKSKLYYLYGNKDEILNQKIFYDNKNLLKKNEIDFEEITFEGKHEIHKESLIGILNK